MPNASRRYLRAARHCLIRASATSCSGVGAGDEDDDVRRKDVEASISASNIDVDSTTTARGRTVPSNMIGEAPYTEPSPHRTRIDAAEKPPEALARGEGLMKQKSATRPTVGGRSRRRDDEESYASFSASTVSLNPRTKSSSSNRSGVVTDPSLMGFVPLPPKSLPPPRTPPPEEGAGRPPPPPSRADPGRP